MFKKIRQRLPKEKTQAELDEHFRAMEAVELERGDLPAMLIAAFISLGLPIALMLGALYSVIYIVFVR